MRKISGVILSLILYSSSHLNLHAESIYLSNENVQKKSEAASRNQTSKKRLPQPSSNSGREQKSPVESGETQPEAPPQTSNTPQDTSDSDQVLKQVADGLEKGDIAAILKHFDPQCRNNYESSFKKFSSGKLAEWANSYRNAKFIKDYKGELRIYKMPIKIPSGETIETEMTLCKGLSGWLIGK